MGAGESSLSGTKVTVGGREVTLQRQLADGAFGSVHLCVDERGRRRALKRLILQTEAQREDAQQEAMCHRRVRAAAQSPPGPAGDGHVMRLLASAMVESPRVPGAREMFMLFPLYSRSLQQVITEEGPLRASKLVQILLGICRGLATLHSCDLSHRDLKPGNVLLSADGVPVLIDLGSCEPLHVKIKGRRAALEATERAEERSSAAFRAPELWEVDRRCTLDGERIDVWALGCTIFAAAFGRGYSPFEHPIRGLEVLAIKNGKICFPERAEGLSKARKVRPGLVALIQKTLQVSASRRPSVAQVRQQLEALSPTQAVPASQQV